MDVDRQRKRLCAHPGYQPGILFPPDGSRSSLGELHVSKPWSADCHHRHLRQYSVRLPVAVRPGRESSRSDRNAAKLDLCYGCSDERELKDGMKPPAIRRFRYACPSRRRECGVTMVLVALAMVAIIAMAALSIDVITLYLAREEAQRSADAAALAAARVISLSRHRLAIPTIPPRRGRQSAADRRAPATLAATAVATQSEVGNTVATTSA